jgi:hypothetical protein
MKTVSLAITAAAGLLFAAQGAHATDRALAEYLGRTNAAAASQVNAAGVDLETHTLAVEARVGSDGRLGAIHVVRSTGSLEADLLATRALGKVRVADTPPGLVGAQVRLTLGPAPIVEAKAP